MDSGASVVISMQSSSHLIETAIRQQTTTVNASKVRFQTYLLLISLYWIFDTHGRTIGKWLLVRLTVSLLHRNGWKNSLNPLQRNAKTSFWPRRSNCRYKSPERRSSILKLCDSSTKNSSNTSKNGGVTAFQRIGQCRKSIKNSGQ